MTLDKASPETKVKDPTVRKDSPKDVTKDKLLIQGLEKPKEKKLKHKTDDKSAKKDRGRSKQKKSRGSSSSSSSSSSSKSRSGSSSSSSSSSGSSSSSSKSKSSASESRSSSSSSSGSSASNRRKRNNKEKARKRRHSKSPSPRRRKRSPTPRPRKVHVGRLTRNIHKDHLYEIFGLYGTIKNIDLPPDRLRGGFSRGFAYVEYENAEFADKAVEHLDGGQIDGQKITVAPVLLMNQRPHPMRRMSPMRRGPFPPPWRRSPAFRPRMDRRRRHMSPFRRRSPRHRSRSRSKSRSPIRRRPARRSSSSSSR